MKGSHGKVVRTTIMGRTLLCEILQRIEGMAGIEALLVFPMAAFNFTIVPWSIGADSLVLNPQCYSSFLKQSELVLLRVGEVIRKFKTVVCLYTSHTNTSATVPRRQFFQEIRGRVSGLFRIRCKKTKTCKLIDSGILK